MATIYFESRTGNVKRFVDKLQATGHNIRAVRITPGLLVRDKGHLITYTDRDGEIPELTRKFVEDNHRFLLSVSSSGNTNWGRTYGMAADRISTDFGLPIILKFELSGLDSDVATFIQGLTKSEHIL
ncbi:class Ib ribonucleoside-diphosphate reductase assembly flavoprotein NrdI [Parapedobacter soli]|uniref:class Ib ribonucleoside-diphosphate reductase assembly flavoprotein NrdI n=1 Tax=Parapedobacter soli TaxID=416955 RepID=UPI0021C9AAE7|nr:class Ib ribonucleoside-diphosphate reductase assembly flavoprotein NrdI [Parapedobacter soli]